MQHIQNKTNKNEKKERKRNVTRIEGIKDKVIHSIHDKVIELTTNKQKIFVISTSRASKIPRPTKYVASLPSDNCLIFSNGSVIHSNSFIWPVLCNQTYSIHQCHTFRQLNYAGAKHSDIFNIPVPHIQTTQVPYIQIFSIYQFRTFTRCRRHTFRHFTIPVPHIQTMQVPYIQTYSIYQCHTFTRCRRHTFRHIQYTSATHSDSFVTPDIHSNSSVSPVTYIQTTLLR